MATILFDQAGLPAGTVDRSRSDIAAGTAVTITAGGIVGTAVFGLLDRPAGSAAALSGTGLTRSLTPDVPGPYRVRVVDDADDSESIHTFTVRTVALQLALPASNERANPDANDVENDADDILASETNEGGTFKGWHENATASLLKLEEIAARALGTGLLEGGIVTQASSTTVDISAGRGQVADYSDPENPIISDVTWAAQLGVAITGVATTDATLLCFDADGNLSQILLTVLTPTDRTSCIIIGTANHTSGVIVSVSDVPDTVGYDGPTTLINFLRDVIGPANESGNVVGANGANLSLDCSGGRLFVPGSNFRVDPALPDSRATAPAVAPTVFVVYAAATVGSVLHSQTAFIDPGVYQDALGSTASVAANDWSIQRVFRSIDGTLVCGLGQETFNQKVDAIDALLAHSFVEYAPLPSIAFRGYLVVKGNATDLSNTAQAEFFVAPKFRIFGAAGSGAPSAGTFLALQDTPNSYSGQAGKLAVVNTGETALEFVDPDLVSWPVSQTAHGLSADDVVRVDSAGDYVAALADDSATLGLFVVIAVAGVDDFTVGLVGRYTSAAHGLTVGDYYYLSATTPGALTGTEPASPNFSNPLVFVVDANTLAIVPWRPSAATPLAASQVTYDNAASGLAATEVQAALDEIVGFVLAGLQTAKANGPITNDGTAPATVLAEPLQSTPLLSGEYRVTAALELQTDVAATWGASGPDGGATAQLTIDGVAFADWFQPFVAYTALGCDLLVPFVFGAEPLIDLTTDRDGPTGNISARRIAVTLELVSQALYPLSISSLFVFGVDATGRVGGTYPDVATEIDAVGPNNCSITQGTASLRPHIVYLNDRPHLGHTNQYLQADATSDLWAIGATEMNVWVTGLFEVDGDTLLTISTGSTSFLVKLNISAGDVNAIVTAGGVQTNVPVTTDHTTLQVYRIHYDGVNITFYVNGVQVAQVAKTGTFATAATRVTLGAGRTGSQSIVGASGTCWIAVGTMTAQEIADMDTYMLADAGLTPSVDDGVDILGSAGVFGVLASDREMGATSPSVEVDRLIDRYHNCDPTASGPGNWMFLTTIGGITYLDDDSTRSLHGAATVDLWASGSATEVDIFLVARWDVAGPSDFAFTVGTGNLTYLAQVSTNLRFHVTAGGAGTDLSIPVAGLDLEGIHLYRAHYDGANMTVWQDGVQIGTRTKTGTWDGAADSVQVGGSITGGNELDGAIRSAWIATGGLTAQQVTDMTAYLMADAGIA